MKDIEELNDLELSAEAAKVMGWHVERDDEFMGGAFTGAHALKDNERMMLDGKGEKHGYAYTWSPATDPAQAIELAEHVRSVFGGCWTIGSPMVEVIEDKDYDVNFLYGKVHPIPTTYGNSFARTLTIAALRAAASITSEVSK